MAFACRAHLLSCLECAAPSSPWPLVLAVVHGLCCLVPQDFLQLDVGALFYTRWVSQQWPKCMAFGGSLNLPRSHGLASAASARARRSDEVTTPEYSLSTALLLALLCRWTATLKQRSGALAMTLLSGVLASCMALSTTLAVLVDSPSLPAVTWPSWPASVRLEIRRGLVGLDPLLAASGSSRRSGVRTLLA